MRELDVDDLLDLDARDEMDEVSLAGARSKARWAGLFIALATLAWFFSVGSTATFLDEDSVARTAANVLASPGFFKTVLLVHVARALLMLFAVGTLGALLEVVDSFWSRLALHVGIATSVAALGSSLLLFGALRLLQGTPYPFTFLPVQMQGFAHICIHICYETLRGSMGLIGLYYLMVGKLVHRSRLLPRWVAVVCMIGAIAWAMNLYPGVPDPAWGIILLAGVLAQLTLGIRLGVKGIDEDRWEQLVSPEPPPVRMPPVEEAVNNVATFAGLRATKRDRDDLLH